MQIELTKEDLELIQSMLRTVWAGGGFNSPELGKHALALQEKVSTPNDDESRDDTA